MKRKQREFREALERAAEAAQLAFQHCNESRYRESFGHVHDAAMSLGYALNCLSNATSEVNCAALALRGRRDRYPKKEPDPMLDDPE